VDNMKGLNSHNPEREDRRRWRRFGPWVTVAVVVATVLVGSAALFMNTRGGASSSENMAAGAGAELPAFAYTSSATLAGYQAAVANQDLFAQMPCYCGCGMHSIAHHNLKECFVRPDGAYESHAASCQICVNIAADVVSLKGQGQSPKDIRQNIDAKYSKYGPSTDTPPVTEG
jgi:hypothetical protein